MCTHVAKQNLRADAIAAATAAGGLECDLGSTCLQFTKYRGFVTRAAAACLTLNNPAQVDEECARVEEEEAAQNYSSDEEGAGAGQRGAELCTMWGGRRMNPARKRAVIGRWTRIHSTAIDAAWADLLAHQTQEVAATGAALGTPGVATGPQAPPDTSGEEEGDSDSDMASAEVGPLQVLAEDSTSLEVGRFGTLRKGCVYRFYMDDSISFGEVKGFSRLKSGTHNVQVRWMYRANEFERAQLSHLKRGTAANELFPSNHTQRIVVVDSAGLTSVHSWDPVTVTEHDLTTAGTWAEAPFDVDSTEFVAAYTYDRTKKEHLCFKAIRTGPVQKRSKRSDA